MSWAAGILLAAIGFVLGKVFSESEKILTEKRRVYEQALVGWPTPHDVYKVAGELDDRVIQIQKHLATLLLYASPSVTLAAQRYIAAFGAAERVLTPESPPLHPLFNKLAQAHNDLILEMRRDAFGWSVFGYRGKSRIGEV